MAHIHRVISGKFRAIVAGKPLPITLAPQKTAETKISLSNFDWKEAEQNVSPQTAVGPDGIPMQLINLLGPKTKESFMRAIDKVIKTKQIPEDWLQSRMNLIYTDRGEKASLDSYRPLTVTSVGYRFVILAIKSEIQAWMEENEIRGELHNEFRQYRRLDDNLFVITQCIEIADA